MIFSVVLLCWAALCWAPSTCYPVQEAPEARTTEYRQAETKSSTNSNLMENNYNEKIKTILLASKGLFTYLNPNKGCFLVLNVKRKKIFCLDSKRKLHLTSVDKTKEDCNFHHIRRHKHYDVFRSCRGEMLVILRQSTANTNNSSTLSRLLLLKHHKNYTNRKKRHSWHTDPADPLGSEYPVMRSISNQRRDPQYVNNISKETIALVEDPLQVLLSHSPLSPTLEKNRKNNKYRF